MKLKDKKIELLQQVTTRDNEGFVQTTLQSVGAPVWAYFRQLSGKEVFAAATTNYKEEVLFTINYRKDITAAHVVRYKGVLHDITRVDTFEGVQRGFDPILQQTGKVKSIWKFNITNTGYNIVIRREMCYTVFCIRVVTFGRGGVNDI